MMLHETEVCSEILLKIIGNDVRYRAQPRHHDEDEGNQGVDAIGDVVEKLIYLITAPMYIVLRTLNQRSVYGCLASCEYV